MSSERERHGVERPTVAHHEERDQATQRDQRKPGKQTRKEWVEQGGNHGRKEFAVEHLERKDPQ